MTTTIIPNPARPGHTCAAQMRGRPCSCGQWAAYHQYHWHLRRPSGRPART